MLKDDKISYLSLGYQPTMGENNLLHSFFSNPYLFLFQFFIIFHQFLVELSIINILHHLYQPST